MSSHCSEQFSLAMYLINQQISSAGTKPIPSTLPTEMIPPSLRSKVSESNSSEVLTLSSFGIKAESEEVYKEIETLRKLDIFILLTWGNFGVVFGFHYDIITLDLCSYIDTSFLNCFLWFCWTWIVFQMILLETTFFRIWTWIKSLEGDVGRINTADVLPV